MSGLLQDVGEESLSLSKKMESKVETYIPNLKRIKEKYTECAETLEHYRRKLSLLQKNVDKQSLANIKQDEHERYERVQLSSFRIRKSCATLRKSTISY